MTPPDLTPEQVIVCGFPGVGKSFAARTLGGIDSDSSSWPRDENWPGDYIENLRVQSGLVFCSTHAEVRAGLVEAGVPFDLAYPSRECKAEYLHRFRERGSSDEFVALLDRMWDAWLAELEGQAARSHIVLAPGEFLLQRLEAR